MIIGLTGQTGAGKSTVCKVFDNFGFVTVDCDKLSREITNTDRELVRNLAEKFGNDILNEDGSLNRKALGNKAFSSKQNTELLNSLTHPAIIKKIKEIIGANKNKTVVLDAPTLFESGAFRLCDKIISVIADENIRLDRIMKRDLISKQAALLRISAQGDDSFYTERSDAVIVNNENGDISQKVNKALNDIGVI